MEKSQIRGKIGFKSEKEKMFYAEQIQPVAATQAFWESDKMITMDDLVDEADFAELFDQGPEIEVETSLEQQETAQETEQDENDELEKKLQKLNDLVQYPQSSKTIWKSEEMVTMEDLLAFDEEKTQEPEKVEKSQTFDVNLAVTALKQIQAANGDQMFDLVDNFLSYQDISKNSVAPEKNSAILDELYKLKEENDKPIEEPMPMKIIIKEETRPTEILDNMISSNTSKDYKMKRKINNAAASRSRAKKKKMIQDQTERISVLEKENPELQKKLDTYESELNGLKRKLEFYQSLNLKTECWLTLLSHTLLKWVVTDD